MIKLLQLLTEVKESIEDFASTRLKGAEKIADTTQEAGGLSLLTYKHYKVKLPYYKKAAEGKFDIKNRAIMPLVDGARLFAISLNLKGINNTYVRFKQLAIADPKFSEIYLNCADAFLILTKFRTLEGLKNDSTGDYINIDELSKVDKEKLKNALIPMKELEELIKDK